MTLKLVFLFQISKSLVLRDNINDLKKNYWRNSLFQHFTILFSDVYRPKKLKFQFLIIFFSFIPVVGHWLVLQLLVSTEFPTQGFPPLDGDGLLHDLDLLCWPPPQLLSHADQAENAPHPPSTTILLFQTIRLFTKAATGVLYKKAVFENSAIITGKHRCWSLFLIKLQAWRSVTLLKRDSNTGEYCKIFKNTYFKEYLQVAASVKWWMFLLTYSTTFLHELFILKVW